jgi:hypothetical protein
MASMTALFSAPSSSVSESPHFFTPFVRRFEHLQTIFFLPFLAHVTRRYSCPHFPQSRMPVRAYPDEYLLFWFFFLVTADLTP